MKIRCKELLINSNFDYNSSYLKKLEFIIFAIEKYSVLNNKKIDELEVLEVGCGEGGITIPLSSLGCNIRAFDVDKKSLVNLSNQIKRRRINNIFLSEDNGYTFTSDKKYDIVIASEVFEHVIEPSKLASNIKKTMRKNSYIIVTTPNGYGPWEIRNRIFYYPIKRNNVIRKLFNKSYYVEGTGPDHCQFFTRNRILKLFSTLGFKKISFKKSDSILAALPLGQKMGKLDTKIADILPSKLASGWYFVFELNTN